MRDPSNQALPYLTRDMLDFEFATTFELVVVTTAFATDPVFIRGATKQGSFTFQVIPNGTGQRVEQRYGLPDVPIWVSAIDAPSLYSQGGLFVEIYLSLNQDRLYTLCSGYVSTRHSITWPQAQTDNSEPFLGLHKKVTSADPAAGTELTITVPDYKMWIIRGVTFTLVNAAAAASRVVHLVFSDGGVKKAECISPTAQIISETKVYTCFPTGGAQSLANDNDIVIPIPQGIYLRQTAKITTETTALDAGDNFSAMIIFVEEYISD